MKIRYEKLESFVDRALTLAGLDEFSKEAVCTGLCEASLRGVDSHGVRLLPHYIESALLGRKNPSPNFKFETTFPSLGHLKADNAFGHAAGMRAIDHAMEIAESQGIGVVGVSNSSHPGAMASMALRAARQGYIAFAYTHADALILSSGGTRPYFGTNPICFAVPRIEEEPYCLDMSCSVITWNKLKMKRAAGVSLPPGVAADENGIETLDPQTASCLMPMGEYKGYGLASMVEVLCGVYTGMPFGRQISSMFGSPIDQPRNLGQFYMVLRCDGVIDLSSFLDRMQQMTSEVRLEPSASTETVMLPGDKEIQEAQRRRAQGIPLDELMLSELTAVAKRLDLDFSLEFIHS